MMQRLEMRFAGRVQGVGFRATVAGLARSCPITGRVCNLSDGRVELLVEGERSDLLRFREAILENMSRYIVDFTEFWSEEVRQGWKDFAIDRDKLA